MAGEKEKTKTTKAAEEQQQQSWGTLEELLLACAVSRHGAKSWDSIAMEVQNRTSTMTSLTPKSCEDKFHDLTCRFGFPSQNDAESGGFLVVSDLVDQLRRIRVQELRAEVQRRDVSIVSLEMKVKKLEEERERSEKADADLERETKALPEVVAGKSSAVEADSDERENRSFNESNSMTQKPETTTNKEQNDVVLDVGEREPTKVKPEPLAEAGPVLGEPDGDRGWSSNGKLNGTGNVKDDDENDKTTSDGEIKKNNKTNGAGGLSEANELWDESKGEGKEAGLRVVAAAAAPKQSSDVQSSASLSKTMRRGGVAGCSSSEEVSPATRKVLAVKSEPLIGVLAIIRSHRLGSHFERRLRSQESERYKKLVRQHIDLRTIQSRLDKGLYSNCFHRFYRDLLLLFNNFIIFFKKTSQEHAAARELRALVIKEMIDKLRKPKSQRELEPPRRVSLSKSSRGPTVVPCGRRSSSVKALSENVSNRKEKEKPKVNNEKKVGSLFGVEEKGVKKKRSNERSSVLSRKNSTSGNNNKSNKKGGGRGGEVKHQYGNNELSSHDGLDAKLDKKEISMKKRGAASFLRRMKQNSPKKVAEEESDEEEEDEDDDEDDDDDKDSEDESKDSRVGEEDMKNGRRRNNNNNIKKNNSNNIKKRDVRRDRVTRSSSNSKGSRGGGGEREESGKKVLGRPPKRSVIVGAGERKRGRDNGESEVGVAGGGGKSARKRARR